MTEFDRDLAAIRPVLDQLGLEQEQVARVDVYPEEWLAPEQPGLALRVRRKIAVTLHDGRSITYLDDEEVEIGG